MRPKKKNHILVVDDDRLFRDSITSLLQERGYSVTSSDSVLHAEQRMKEREPDVLLTDIVMKDASGIDLLEKVHREDPDLPVILMSAFSDFDNAVKAVKKGAFDYIVKPYDDEHLLYAVEKALKHHRLIRFEKNNRIILEETVRTKTLELTEALAMNKHLSDEIVQRLTTVAEFRDPETGAHISRMSLYCRALARAMEMPGEFVERITFASPMHDIGKVGIADSILLKPGRLTADEFAIMKTHTQIGHRLLSGSPHPGIKMAASVALNHHERWDGSGYPGGLKGGDIPVEGRILMICDCYDAARSHRPYKEAVSHASTMRMLLDGNEIITPDCFDPEVLKAFERAAPSFDGIFNGKLP